MGCTIDEMTKVAHGGWYEPGEQLGMIEQLLQERSMLINALQFGKEKIAELHIELGDGDFHNYAIIDDALDSVKAAG